MRSVRTRSMPLVVVLVALAVPAAAAATGAASPTVRPGPGQIAIVDAPPGVDARVLVGGDAAIAEGAVDLAGSLLFRGIEPGDYTVEIGDGGSIARTDVTVPDFGTPPPQRFYDDQDVGPGFGYVTVRDGTTLSVNVVLPGDIDDGPFPTVVEYSAYDPSDPAGSNVGLSALMTALGYAWVGVNMRGSGCSGGSFDYFEPIQATDGYDVIETIAAQPWVAGNAVGMAGVSYAGVSQLYVAAQRPPSLLAITPLSVVDDSSLYTLYPGGILNDGFAVDWARQRDAETAPFGQAWTRDRIADGDETCRANQLMRLQNPKLEQQIRENPYYSAIAEKTDVRPLIGDIEVPVFL